MNKLLVFFILGLACFGQLSLRDPRWQTIGVGLNGAKPATCVSLRHVYICTDCTLGANILYCDPTGVSPNSWVAQGGSGGLSSGTVQHYGATGTVPTELNPPAAGVGGWYGDSTAAVLVWVNDAAVRSYSMKNVTCSAGQAVTTMANGVSTCSAVGGGYDTLDLSTFRKREDWCGGITSNGSTLSYGSMGWRAFTLAGSLTLANSGEASHPCLLSVTTSTTSGDGVGFLNYGAQQFLQMPYGSLTTMGATSYTWKMVMNFSNVSNMAFELALNAAGSAFNQSTNTRVRYDTSLGDTTFVLENCNSFHCTTLNSSVTPVANTTYTVSLGQTVNGTMSMSVNGESAKTLATDCPTTTVLTPVLSFKTLTAAARTMKLFAGSVEILGLVP